MKIQQWTVIWCEQWNNPCPQKVFEDANELGRFVADLLKRGITTTTVAETFRAESPKLP